MYGRIAATIYLSTSLLLKFIKIVRKRKGAVGVPPEGTKAIR